MSFSTSSGCAWTLRANENDSCLRHGKTIQPAIDFFRKKSCNANLKTKRLDSKTKNNCLLPIFHVPSTANLHFSSYTLKRVLFTSVRKTAKCFQIQVPGVLLYLFLLPSFSVWYDKPQKPRLPSGHSRSRSIRAKARLVVHPLSAPDVAAPGC